MAGRLTRLFVGFACAAVGLVQPAHAQPTEQAVKAAFLSKFARYVTWPPNARPGAGESLVVCIVGSDSLGPLVDRAAAGQTVDQHPIAIRRLASGDGAGACQIAFVNGGSAHATAGILAALRNRPVLTVTDGASGARGMIHFTVHQGRVRFYIDNVAAVRSNLSIDSRLLSIALGVKQSGR
jgi:hypothetical protein